MQQCAVLQQEIAGMQGKALPVIMQIFKQL
jgi:hypothetical protein